MFQSLPTDASGSVAFQLYPTEQYKVVLDNASEGIVNQSFYVIPSSPYYAYMITPNENNLNPTGINNITPGYNGSQGTGNMWHDINASVIFSQEPDGTGLINCSYTDLTESTTSVTFLVYSNTNNASGPMSNPPIAEQTSTTFNGAVAQWNSVPTTTNVLNNYNFANGKVNWTGWGGGGTTWLSVVNGSGAYSENGAMSYADMAWVNSSSWQQMLTSQEYTVQPGAQVTFAAMLTSTSAPTAYMQIWWINNSGGVAGIVTQPVSANNTWAQYSVTGTPPSNATGFEVSFTATGSGNNNLLIDYAQAVTQEGESGNGYYTFTIANASGMDVLVQVQANPAAYNGNFQWTTSNHFLGPSAVVQGMPGDWYYWLVACFLFLVAGVTVSGSLGVGGGIMCFYAYIFYFIGWFNPLGSTGTLAAITLALIMSIGVYLIEQDRRR
jgi:hypothetical protein